MSVLLLIGFLVCVVAAVSDLWRGTIPNALTYPLIALSPPLRIALSLLSGYTLSDALLEGGLSLVGIVACGAVPYFMWKRQAIGGGDVKMFAGLGALLLPRFGFEAELYVFVAACLLAPAELA